MVNWSANSDGATPNMPIILGPTPTPPVAPTTATSLDGLLTVTVDAVNGGVLLQADYSAATPQPYQVRFLREGVPVRSGDTAWAPGGYAIAYDYEMPLGVASSWTAEPIFMSAGVLTAGTPSLSVAIFSPDIDTIRDFWVKSIPDPALSLRLRSAMPDPGFTTQGRNSLSDIPGSKVQAGSWDVGVNGPVNISFVTVTHTERDDLLTLLDSGALLVQALNLYGIYDFYAVANGVEQSYMTGAYDPRRVISVSFVPVGRPATVGAPLYVPGQSYDDVAAGYATYDILTAAIPDYLSVVAP